MKKGFVTPTTMFGLKRGGEKKKQNNANLRVSFTQTVANRSQGSAGYLRSLCPGGILFKFTVVDGKIGTVVTTVPQRSKAAVTTERRVAIQTSERRSASLHQVYVLEQCFVLPEVTLWSSSRLLFSAEAEFKAGETKFLGAMTLQVSQDERLTFLYHWWNTSKTKTLLPYCLS